MSASIGNNRSKVLTEKFRREREEISRLAAPYDPWVILSPPQYRATLRKTSKGQNFPIAEANPNDATTLDLANEEITSDTEQSMTGFCSTADDTKIITDIRKLALLTKDGQLDNYFRLHALCASSSTSIEIVRM
jgi:hypothetical protein